MSEKILVVEDSPDSRDMISCLLRLQGYEVITAEDGQQAMDMLGVEHPGLIITDIQMPNMDGIELIKRLRRQSELRNIPILVMSAYRSGVVSEALDAGATAAARKPIQFDSLLQVVRHLLPLSMSLSLFFQALPGIV